MKPTENKFELQHSIDSTARKLNYHRRIIFLLLKMKILTARYDLKIGALMISDESLKRFQKARIEGRFYHVVKLPTK